MTETHLDVQTEGRSPKKFSRRDFLKLAGLGMGALSLSIIKDAIDVTKRLSTLKSLIGATADLWQPAVVDLGIDSLENPAVIESVLGNSAGSLEALVLRDHRAEGAPKIETNPSYKPMTKIIGEVLDKRRSEGKPVTYQRINGYEGLPYYQNKLRKEAGDPANREIHPGGSDSRYYILGYNPNIIFNLMMASNFLPDRAHDVWMMSGAVFEYSLDLIENGTGFLDRTIEILDEEARINNWSLKNDYWQTHQNEINQIVKTYLQDIKQHVEKLVIQTGAPISAGEIFSYCMDRNGESINKSLMDTTIFLKYMARNDTTLLTFNGIRDDPEKARANEDWFKANIKDEYGKVGNYSKLPHETYPYHGLLSAKPGAADLEVDKDLHLLNQIGKPYHAWNIATLLTALPPAMAQIGVAWEQYTYFKEHGPAKTASDFRVALELNKLDSLFIQ